MRKFSKSLNPKNIDKSVSDIRMRIRFPFESSFWISVSGCKLTNLPDIQPANWIVIICDLSSQATCSLEQCCQLVYIYTKFENFGIFSKCLVHNFLIWYIRKIWLIFGIFSSEGLVVILNQFIWLITKRKQINRQW